MSMFDPAALLDASTTEVNEKRPLIPVECPGTDDALYTAIIGEVKIASGSKEDKAWVSVTVPLKFQIPEELQALGIPKELTLTDRVFLDLTANGTIDNSIGKNNGQRKYREATNLNKPGVAFSWRMVQGQPVKVKIKHEEYEGNWLEKPVAVFPL